MILKNVTYNNKNLLLKNSEIDVKGFLLIFFIIRSKQCGYVKLSNTIVRRQFTITELKTETKNNQ